MSVKKRIYVHFIARYSDYVEVSEDETDQEIIQKFLSTHDLNDIARNGPCEYTDEIKEVGISDKIRLRFYEPSGDSQEWKPAI